MGRAILALVLLAALEAAASEPLVPEPGPIGPGCYTATRWRMAEDGKSLDVRPPPGALSMLLVCWNAQGQVTTAEGLSDRRGSWGDAWLPIWPMQEIHPDCGRLVGNLGPPREGAATSLIPYFVLEGGELECTTDRSGREPRTLCYCKPPAGGSP